jgi:Tfp pilus assembly protein PilO
MKSSLTSLQQKTLMYIVGSLVLLGIAGAMLYDANRRVKEAATLVQETDRKEQEAAVVQIPSDEDQAQWAEKDRQLASLLLSDQQVPEFLEDVARLANENHLQRLGINNEDKVIDPNQPGSPEDGKLASVGIRRYLLVTLKFQSEYPDAARFLAAVSQLPRPVEFQVVDMRRNPPALDMTLVLKVYKREPAPA